MAAASTPPTIPALHGMAVRYTDVRRFTQLLCEPLETEDFVVQSMPDVSPTKWHLAHTTWFFETFVLKPHARGYTEVNPAYAFLFNSYYVQAGERHCRAQRGYISRPTVAEVFEYRKRVDEAMLDLLAGTGGNDDDGAARLLPLIELGLNHEQQHQELLLTDIKHVLSVNPLRPAYSGGRPHAALAASPMKWIPFEAALCEIGATGNTFAFDNEMPRHRTFLHDFQLASRPVTNGEYLDFIDDGGYNRADLWLSLGWAQVSANKWTAPFYWEHRSDGWYNFTLAGMRPVAPDEPACHISYFEAEAYARWAGVRLPSESEWEVAAAGANIEGNFAESGAYHPRPAAPVRSNGPQQLFGDVWEWTQSQYSPYPGFRAAAGALGEYNAKFMCNQFVLRGGSCATPRTHVRPSYRNFFPPEATWQFTGFRLARDV